LGSFVKGLFQAVGLDRPPNLFLKLEQTRFINPVSTGVFFPTGPRHQQTVNSFQTGETAKKMVRRGVFGVSNTENFETYRETSIGYNSQKCTQAVQDMEEYGATVRMQPSPCLACYLPVWCSDLTDVVTLCTRQ
jgi:hypothetical protein